MAKTDDGFKQTDEMLKDLESKIHKEYEQASREITEKANKYFARFQDEDDAMRDAWQNGEITKHEYAEWRTRKMQRGQYYTEMKNTLARDLVNTDKIAMSYVNDRVIDVYALNMNYGTYSIEKDSKINTSFSLYNRSAVQNLIKNNPQLLPSPKVDIPKDMRWNQQHIQSAITQGILQGKSIPEIAKNLQSVTGMDERAALRNARTAMTGAQNAGRLDSMKRAQARGVAVKKGWLATLDHVTRDSHVDLDGEVQELDKTFSNGLMYPADGTGAPEEVYNCRCRLTHEYDKYKTDWSNLENRKNDKLGSMSYQEWKDNHKEKATKIRAKQKVTEKAVKEFIKVSTKKEAIESLGNIFEVVEPSVKKLDEELLVENVNRLNELNARFGCLTENNKGYVTGNAERQRRAIAWTSSDFRNPDKEDTVLSLVSKYYKDKDFLIETEQRGVSSFWSMPCDESQLSIYTITHEYGHILQNRVIRGRTDLKGLQDQIHKIVNPTGNQLRLPFKEAEEKGENDIYNEIIDIAKKNNPNFVLDDNLSKYGHTNKAEFFAEVFANSQCGKPNELGNAMIEWLEKEGF